MKELEKYIYEDDTIYELGEHDVYYYVIRPEHHEECLRGSYSKVRFNYLLENNLEFLAELANNDKFDDYFFSYQKEMVEKEQFIVSKSNSKDVMAKLMAREFLMYQELT